MSMLSDDLAAIYADASVTVAISYSGKSTRGHTAVEDVPEEDGMGGLALVTRRVATFAVGALGTITNDTAITVDGVQYRVHSVRLAGTGRTKVILA